MGDLRDGRADLSLRLASSSSDEFGQIAEAFNAYTEALERIVARLARCIEQLASASEEISSSASLSAENGRLQSEQAQQVPWAEMSTAVEEVAANSQKASESALKTVQAAHGLFVVGQLALL